MKKKIISSLLVLSLMFVGCTNIDTKFNNKIHSETQATKSNVSSGNIGYYFTKAHQNPDKQLIGVVDSSGKTLDIAIYSLTKKSIVDSIIRAKNRGVAVRIISDKIQSKGKSESRELSELKNAKIPIKLNNHPGLMHMKVTIADINTVTTGSYNYTDNATRTNDEVLVILHDKNIANGFENEFEQMWQSREYSNY